MSKRVDVIVLEITFIGGFDQAGEVTTKRNKISVVFIKCPILWLD